MAGTRIAGVELGGTKAIAVLWEDGALLDERRMPTGEDAAATLEGLHTVLRHWHRATPLSALGIATFGPVMLDKADSRFGQILATPKAGWSGAPVYAALTGDLPVPACIDTDVNGAALAEYHWGSGAGQSLESLVYLTIGTGLGGGVVAHGKPLHGRLHPELGHMRLRRSAADDFPGHCPFHKDCAEGLLSGPALAARFGAPADTLAADDPRWAFPRADLAELLANILHMLAPQRILIGGGVGIGAPHVLHGALDLLPQLLAGYYPDLSRAELARIITHPALGEHTGPLGAIALGLAALES